MLFQSSAEAGDLCRYFCSPFRGGGDDLYPFHQAGGAQRVRDDRDPDLLYVCDPVCDRGDHWGVYCDSVQRTEGPADLCGGGDEERGEIKLKDER